MFFKQKSNVLFRNYEYFGYITDNRNFGYKPTIYKENNIGDKIVSQSGAVFLSVLGRKPQRLNDLAKKIQKHFKDVTIEIIKNDAVEFYNMFEKDGFIVSGETYQECIDKDTGFSYKLFEPEVLTCEISQRNIRTANSTQDFLREYYKDKPQLTNLHIEITSRCNERCLHCYIPHDEKISEIKPTLFNDILAQCKELRLLHLTLSGGEPMQHKHFCDFLKKCNEYEFSVNVLSNLTLLNNDIITEMKSNSLLGVQVSLYSMDSNIHDQITQLEGSFEKTKNAILKLIENDIPLQISCPILKHNKHCYHDVVDWAQKHRIYVGHDYDIIASYNHTTQNLSCRLSMDEIKEVIIGQISNDTKYLEQLEKDAEEKKDITLSDNVCSVCRYSACIADNGNVYPCVGWQDFIVGNVNDTPLKEIWCNSEKVQYLRDLRKQDFPMCKKCPDKEFCTMCMVRNANENPLGDLFAVNEYFCSIAKLKRKMLLEWK